MENWFLRLGYYVCTPSLSFLLRCSHSSLCRSLPMALCLSLTIPTHLLCKTDETTMHNASCRPFLSFNLIYFGPYVWGHSTMDIRKYCFLHCFKSICIFRFKSTCLLNLSAKIKISLQLLYALSRRLSFLRFLARRLVAAPGTTGMFVGHAARLGLRDAKATSLFRSPQSSVKPIRILGRNGCRKTEQNRF